MPRAAAGVPVNVIDKPAFCDFSFGAIVNRSPLVIGISTDGAAPVFAQAIRAKLEALLPNGFAPVGRGRRALARGGESVRSVVRRPPQILAIVHRARGRQSRARPAQSDFDRFVAEVRGLGGAVENGSVTLVGAGPGDPELLTLRAVRALQSADVILFDDLVSREVLDFARREAKKLLVGKTGFGPSCKQDDINALMVSLARQGKRVVRLKGGDPLIFGRAGEEIAACKAANIAVEIVPGITAAQGRGREARLVADRPQARAPPAIRHRPRQRWPIAGGHRLAQPRRPGHHHGDLHAGEDACTRWSARAIAEGLDPQTPALAIARATRPDQQAIAATIAELPARLARSSICPGPVLVMLGRVLGAWPQLLCATIRKPADA